PVIPDSLAPPVLSDALAPPVLSDEPAPPVLSDALAPPDGARTRFLGHVGGFSTLAEQASRTDRASLDSPIAPPAGRPVPVYRSLSAGQVLATVLACLGLWALIDAPAL